MPTRIPLDHRAMRKAPRQQRSHSTVEGIVEAGARVLAQRGWAKFTTNEVAQAAGASIGSLYQYFPNKLAIAEAIRQRHLKQILSVLPDPATWSKSMGLEQQVDQLIDGVIALHAMSQKLHRVLLEEVPLAARSSYAAFEQEYHRRYEALVQTTTGNSEDRQSFIAAQILADTVEGIVHAAARRDQLKSPDVKIEARRMVVAYLLARRRSRWYPARSRKAPACRANTLPSSLDNIS